MIGGFQRRDCCSSLPVVGRAPFKGEGLGGVGGRVHPPPVELSFKRQKKKFGLSELKFLIGRKPGRKFGPIFQWQGGPLTPSGA